MARKSKNFNPKAGLITFGVIALGMIALLHTGVAAALIAGAAVGGVVGVMFSPLDTTTHNRQDANRRKIEEARQIPKTGNAVADPMIENGLQLTEQIEKNLSLLTEEEELAASVRASDEKALQILRSISEAPDKAPRVRKFINYYLPVADKLLSNYCEMKQRGVSGDELKKAKASATEGFAMIRAVCEKQLDALHSENMLDMETDLEVLETMLIRDGYTEPIQKAATETRKTFSAVTATEEQLRSGGVPVIQFPPEEAKPLNTAVHTQYNDQ